MGVVIVQSKATAHVFRIFAALVALLVIVAVVVTVSRFRAGREASPYGALSALDAKAPSAALSGAASVPAATRAAQTTSADVPTSSRGAIAASGGGATTVAEASVPVSPAPADAIRRIALDKAAATSPVPQPAPVAMVQAAARASTTPAVPSSASPAIMPSAATSPLVATASSAAGVAAVPASSAPAPAAIPQAAGPVVDAALEQPVATDQTPPPEGVININTATLDQLNSIPGAGRIGRTIIRHRPYRSVEDLVDHRVLKARDLARIRSAITAN